MDACRHSVTRWPLFLEADQLLLPLVDAHLGDVLISASVEMLRELFVDCRVLEQP